MYWLTDAILALLNSFTSELSLEVTLYSTLILPVLLYDAEVLVLSKADEALVGAFEKKILRKVYGPIRVYGEYRRRMNMSGLYYLLYLVLSPLIKFMPSAYVRVFLFLVLMESVL